MKLRPYSCYHGFSFYGEPPVALPSYLTFQVPVYSRNQSLSIHLILYFLTEKYFSPGFPLTLKLLKSLPFPFSLTKASTFLQFMSIQYKHKKDSCSFKFILVKWSIVSFSFIKHLTFLILVFLGLWTAISPIFTFQVM